MAKPAQTGRKKKPTDAQVLARLMHESVSRWVKEEVNPILFEPFDKCSKATQDKYIGTAKDMLASGYVLLDKELLQEFGYYNATR